jgi:hypothetical protein
MFSVPILAADEAVVALILMMAGGIFIAMIAILSHHWRRARESAYNARLKQLMIERGMSAAEIERVISAREQPPAHHRPPTI